MSIYVDQKNAALANVEDAETQKLLLEDASLAVTLNNLPASHPSFAVLTARRATIKAVVASKK